MYFMENYGVSVVGRESGSQREALAGTLLSSSASMGMDSALCWSMSSR